MIACRFACQSVLGCSKGLCRVAKNDPLWRLNRRKFMAAPTHAEPGCRLYELYESSERGRFYFYELWESQAALEQHAASPHYKHLELIVPDLLEEPFEVNILKEVLNLES